MGKKKLTKEEFIKKAREIHGDKYDYSKVEYVNNKTNVCIICPIHGEFWQRPDKHLRGQGCSICSKNKKFTKESFIQQAKEVHGDKYDYSKVEYVGYNIPICIICPIHGEFWQTPHVHLRGCGCYECGLNKIKESKKSTTEEFIEKAKKVHGDKYDYSKVDYKDAHTKVCIICPIHGEFWQTPNGHLNGGGCKECAIEYTTKLNTFSLEYFIKKAKEIHGDKYDYSKVEYINNHTKVCIICPIHGEFWQTPNDHLDGHGCSLCSGNKKSNTEEFIEKARKIHGDKYDYSKVIYKSCEEKVCIICPIHGEFWQTPNGHLNGNGCLKCKSSKLEKNIRLFLEYNKITFEEQKKFSWLGLQRLDFYLPQYNIAIECQGIQHFEDGHFHEKLEVIQERDKRKLKLCKENNIKLIYYSNLEIDYPYKVIEKENELLTEITKK